MSLSRRHFVAVRASTAGIAATMPLFDDRVSAVPGAKLRPANASLADHHQLQRRLGLSRMVILQPSTYGFNNQVMLDGLIASNGAARGITVTLRRVAQGDPRCPPIHAHRELAIFGGRRTCRLDGLCRGIAAY